MYVHWSVDPLSVEEPGAPSAVSSVGVYRNILLLFSGFVLHAQPGGAMGFLL